MNGCFTGSQTSAKKGQRTGPTVIKLEKILKDFVMLFSMTSRNNSRLIISISDLSKVSLRITSII